jgi:co-chaperonin GroES (HSP10)
MPPPVDIELDALKVYGKFLAIDTSAGQIHQGTGTGKVVALGFEVQNYAAGPILKVGEDVLFRAGTEIKFSSSGTVVFVEMGDVIAQVKLPEDTPGTQPA